MGHHANSKIIINKTVLEYTKLLKTVKKLLKTINKTTEKKKTKLVCF